MGNFIVRTSVLEQVYNGLLDIQKKSSALGEVDLPCSLDEFMRRLHDANIKAFNEAHHSTPAVAGRFTLDPTGIALKPAAVLKQLCCIRAQLVFLRFVAVDCDLSDDFETVRYLDRLINAVSEWIAANTDDWKSCTWGEPSAEGDPHVV